MADRRQIVLDASVVVKWLHQEDKTSEALRLLSAMAAGELRASVPDLVLYEISNALVRGIGTPEREVDLAVDRLVELPWWEVVPPTTTLLKDAVSLAAKRRGLTVYDAVYAALALRRGAELITADDQLHRLIGPPVSRLL